MVLKDVIPPHQQQMITQNLAPYQGGQTGHVDDSTSAHVVIMANETIALTTQAKTYDTNPNKQPNGRTYSLP